MDIVELREFCLSLPVTSESTPFDETTLVYKVGDKMFACADMVDDTWVALKCEPSHAIELREAHSEITTASHFNKTHWNSVGLDGDLPADFIKKLIMESYFLVIKGMTRAKRGEILDACPQALIENYENFVSKL